MDKKEFYDTIIIGAGVSGLAAALYTGRFKMKTLIIGEKSGGTIVLTDKIENYPGIKSISGIELAKKIKEHALEYGIKIINKRAMQIKKCKEGCFKVYADKKEFYHTKTIIIATGTEWRKLNVPGEKEFTGKGVHYCALCDGAFYKNKIVGVVGGSDSAAKEALLLSEYAKKVYIIYRKDKIRAEPINKERVSKNKKIEIITKTNVKEIKGDKFVTHVILDNPHKRSKEFKLDGLFVDVGHVPVSDLVKPIKVKLNKKNEVIIDRECKTNIKGVFAAGDVVDTIFKQAITGVAEGVKAAYSAYHYVNSENIVYPCSDE